MLTLTLNVNLEPYLVHLVVPINNLNCVQTDIIIYYQYQYQYQYQYITNLDSHMTKKEEEEEEMINTNNKSY